MIIFPEELNDPMIFMFGTSSAGRDEGLYIHSDIGYLINMVMLGLAGLTVLLMFYFYMLYGLFQNKSNPLSKYVIYIIIILLVINFKESVLFTKNILYMILAFYFIIVLYPKNKISSIQQKSKTSQQNHKRNISFETKDTI